MKIELLKPYQKNAKKHDKKQIKGVADSIKRFGFVQPIVIDKNNEVVIGHARLEAAKLLNLKEVPTISVENLTDEEVKSLRLADNKLNESEWDMGLAIEELKGLSPEMFDLTGFDADLLIEPDEKDDVIPENPPTIAKLGDIWQLGRHRLMCGDATKKEDVERLMDGKKADMVFTDPPYGIEIVGKNGKVGADKLAKNQVYSEVIGDDTINTAKDFYNNCIEIGFKKFILWGGNYFLSFLPFSPCWLVWDKRGDMNSNNFADGEMAWTNVKTRVRIYKQIWNGMIREGEHDKRLHPTQKPVMTLQKIINDFTKENEIIFDGFGGSGSTLIACEKTNRICYMMELDEKYCDVIIKRYEDYTQSKAIKVLK